MKLSLRKKLIAKSGKVKSVDFHPTFSWILLGLYDGSLSIYDYNTQAAVQYLEVTVYPIRCAKFMPEKNYIICGADDKMIRVFNYNTMEKVKEFEAHSDFIRSIIVHYKEPLFLTSSDDSKINLYDAGNNFELKRTYEEHSDFVMRLASNPKDYNMFASASMDKKIKIWSYNAPNSQMTLEGHLKGIGALAFCPLNDKPYLASGSDDCSIKIWDYTNKQCIYTLKGHESCLSSLCFHPELPILISGSEDCTCKFWNINTSKIEESKIFGYDCIWDITSYADENLIGLGCEEATIVFQLGNTQPLATFSSAQSKIVYCQQNNVYSINLKQIQNEAKDGEIIYIPPKQIGNTEVYPTEINYSPNGRYISILSDKEFIISPSGVYRSSCVGNSNDLSWNDNDSFIIKDSNQVKIYKDLKEIKKFKPGFNFDSVFGGPLFALKTSDAVYFYDLENTIFIRKIDVSPNKIIWNENKSLVALICDEGTFILKVKFNIIEEYIENAAEGNIKTDEDGCEESFDVFYDINENITNGFFVDEIFVYQTAKNKINYSVNDKVFPITTLSSKYFLLGYLPSSNHIYLINKNFQIISYTLPLSFLEYEMAIIRKDYEKAKEIFPTVPDEFNENLILFLEKFNHYDMCYDITKNTNKKFSLALKLKKLEDAWKMADKEKNSEKFKMVADLSMEMGNFKMAEKAMLNGNDYNSLLLLYSSIQNREKMKKLFELTKAKGLLNIAFPCAYQLNDLEECKNILIESKRFPEASLFCRTYCPSKLNEVIEKWNEALENEDENSRVVIKILNPVTEENKDIINEAEKKAENYYKTISEGYKEEREKETVKEDDKDGDEGNN
ncbi:MAG: coatomer subunit beta' [archaeon]|nr:coatomer subunit beta' [archaeon]